MTKLLHKELTHQIIGVYYDVYNRLSQTYPEFIYEQAMIALLERAGIQCVQQDEYEIRYKDRLVGLQRLDIFIAGEVVVELKVAGSIDPIHLAQLLSYLKTVSKEVGLLFRFGGSKPDFARRVLTAPAWHDTLSPTSSISIQRDDLLHHLQVDSRALLFPVAVSNIKRISIANLKAWMRHLDIPLGILANFKTTRLAPIVLRT